MPDSVGDVVNVLKGATLTLFRPGGRGRILPARTLDVYNFFNKQAKATELGDFS